MGLTLTTAPAAEPLSTAEAKAHIRVDHANDDTYIASLVTAARLDTEAVTWRQLITATYTLTLDGFPSGCDYIDLPRPPLQSVTSVQYVDTNGDTQTFASGNYTVSTSTAPGRIYLAYNATWPGTRAQRDAVTIVYIAGYGDAGSDVPESIRTGLRLKVGHWYESREAVVMGSTPKELPIGVQRIDDLHKFRGDLNVYADGLTAP